LSESENDMRAELFNQFDPDPESLLRAISARVDDAMLREIARADCGEEEEEHFAALVAIRDSGRFPTPAPWNPLEVMELIRWSEPEDLNWGPSGRGESGHWMRAFCCAGLLCASVEPWNWNQSGTGWTGIDSTVVQLVLSLCLLPVDLTKEAAGLYAYLLLHSDPDGSYEYACPYGLALLFFLATQEESYSDEAKIDVAKWVLERATDIQPYVSTRLQNRAFAAIRQSQKCGAWKSFAERLASVDLSSRSLELQQSVKRICTELQG
jgi:hypothetical protein